MMDSIKLLALIAGLALILGFVNSYAILNITNNSDSITGESVAAADVQDQPKNEPQPSNEPQEPPRVTVSADDDPVKGSENAPVTIIEFADFQCPFCARFYSQTLPQIEENYIKTGKVKLIYRDFPLSNIHKDAQKAAEAAECADDQDKFWEMHDKIFENQGSLSVENFKKWAEDLGLDTEEFDDCLDSGKHASEVQNDLRDGSSYGVRGTPAFFVNGILVSGAQPYSVFQQAIEYELNK